MASLIDALHHDYALVTLFFLLLTAGMAMAYGVLALLGMADHRGETGPAPVQEAIEPPLHHDAWLMGS